jgi:membrane protease YdiL (CAAX protease family)
MSAASEFPARDLPLFFAIVFGTTWLFQLPAILVQRGIVSGSVGSYMPLVVLGYFAPTIAALVLARGGPGGVGALVRQFAPFHVSPGWYVAAAAHPAAILMIGMALARLVGGPEMGEALYQPNAAQLAAMVVIPFTEQIPWRGFVYPTLERRAGPLVASIVTGAAWGLFHLQKQLLIGPGLALSFALSLLLLMTAGTVVYTWIYRRTGSMLLVVIANAGIYLDNPAQALPANVVPLAVDALGYAAAAVLLCALDRPSWRTVAAIA